MSKAGEMTIANPGAARDPSPILWGKCPQDELNSKGTGFYVHETFHNKKIVSDASVEGWQMNGTNNDYDAITDTLDGGISLEVPANDNDDSYIARFGIGQVVLQSQNRLWFEARIQLVNGPADVAVICGLGEEDFVADDAIQANGTAIMDKDFIGWRALTSDQSYMDAITKVDASETVHLNDGQNLVAATWYKFGFFFDGKNKIEYFVDGVLVARGTVTATTVAVSTLYGPVIGLKQGASTPIQFLYLNWVRYAAEW